MQKIAASCSSNMNTLIPLSICVAVMLLLNVNSAVIIVICCVTARGKASRFKVHLMLLGKGAIDFPDIGV